MFSQPSRQQFAPMSVPQGSPRQSSGMSGKGGPSRPSPGGMGGKGGGGPQGMGGPTVGQMNQAISQPMRQSNEFAGSMRPSMFSAASNMFGNQNANNDLYATSLDRTGTLTSLPYMGPSNAGQAAGVIASKMLDPSSTNFTVAGMQNAQPMGQMLPPSQPSPQTLTPLPGFQTQQASFPPSMATPRPQIPTPQSPAVMPQLPPGLMQTLQNFRGF